MLAALLLLAYPLLCSALRFQRINSLRRKYPYGRSRAWAAMTDDAAYAVIQALSELECPAVFEKGLQFALFRTYGIPSVSALLVQTAQLTRGENVGKRYADTAALLVEMYANAPGSERAAEAFARLNYLHGRYIRAGRIGNDDMLYTLALFMTQPVRWVDRYEWRRVTELERCAMGVWHKSMGDGMQIGFQALEGSRRGWRDGLQFYDELAAWMERYEREMMRPHRDNYHTAVQTRVLLMSTLPG